MVRVYSNKNQPYDVQYFILVNFIAFSRILYSRCLLLHVVAIVLYHNEYLFALCCNLYPSNNAPC
jgi:hypothetical protein